MPFATSAGCRIYYRLEGVPGRPLLVLGHSLACDHGQWDPQMAALLARFRVLRVDLRGHGASDAPAGDYAIEQLGRDVLAAVDACGVSERFAYCGLSLGGMIGQWLGLHAGERLTALVLANTSARLDDPAGFDAARLAMLQHGMTAVEAAVMERFFSDRAPAAMRETVRATLLATHPVGCAGCCAAIRDLDHREMVSGIRVPTLVIGSEVDQSTPWKGHGDLLASRIPGARAVVFDSAHLSNIERPSTFNAALFDFLQPDGPKALDVRRSVLGDAHVDRSLSNATEFNREFQELITQYAWGAIWTRPGLEPKTRRMLVLVITAAMGRWEEFRLHVRTGLAHELEMCDLKEVLLQVAVYAGVPAANTGFHAAAEEAVAISTKPPAV
jgi:3-oxoadipate enol-lactonase/4-carboxymuconolactone decarboxylase